MKLNRVGFVGWRGMVGSALLQRMIEEDDFSLIEQPVFYTISQTGQPGPDIGRKIQPLQEASDLESPASLDVIVTCQGGDYTSEAHAKLRRQGWNGYWINAAWCNHGGTQRGMCETESRMVGMGHAASPLRQAGGSP